MPLQTMLQEAWELSRKSDVRRCKFACFIASERHVLIRSTNVAVFGIPGKFTLHAEELAILKASRKRIFERFDNLQMYVFRLAASRDLRPSKPCATCMRLIKSTPIRKILFIDDNDLISTLTLR